MSGHIFPGGRGGSRRRGTRQGDLLWDSNGTSPQSPFAEALRLPALAAASMVGAVAGAGRREDEALLRQVAAMREVPARSPA